MQLLKSLIVVAVLCLVSCAKSQKIEEAAPIAAQTPTPSQTKLAGGKPFGNPANTKYEIGQGAVYGVLLGEITYGQRIVSPDDIAVIKEQSIGGGDVKKIALDSSLEKEMLDAFVDANSETTAWKHYFDVYIDYKIAPADSIPPVGSKEFKTKFPKAKCVVGLSKVGFNKEWTQALAMTEIECEQSAKKSIYWLIYADEGGVATVKKLASY